MNIAVANQYRNNVESDPNETASETGKIVAIDDDPMTLRVVQSQLQMAGHEITTAINGVSGLELIDDSVAVALVDLRMPDLNGIEVLRHVRRYHPHVQVIILTGSSDVNDAVEAMREGAFQFLTKPVNPPELVVYVAKAIEAWRMADENRDLRESHSQSFPVRAVEPAGDVQRRLMKQVKRIAESDSTVYIGGESGTGKSTIARLIHQKSSRAKKPFVTVNCASLPRDLIQSELFGHTRGAFTGAVKDRAGHAEVADGGTLFLDEIGDLPLDLQPKLLTFLQDRTIQRLGATTSRKVDVRLIVATHRDLAEMCREKLFRHDLYFRLLVLSLELPPLRDRMGELPGIATSILKRICQRQSLAPMTISQSSLDLLCECSWPGNIRELENVLERAVAFCESNEVQPQDLLFSNVSLDRRDGPESMTLNNDGKLGDRKQAITSTRIETETQRSDLPTHDGSPMDDSQVIDSPAASSQAEPSSAPSLAGMKLQDIEREAIIQTLAICGGNKAKCARTLGISEKSIYNKMRRLNIKF